jgi:hypothetical protein
MCILIGKMELLSKCSLFKIDVPVQHKYIYMLPGVYSVVSSTKCHERYGSGGGYLGNLCHLLFILWCEWVMTPCGPVGGFHCYRGTY